MTPILVTRPSPDGERLLTTLQRLGLEAKHTPLMAIAPLKVPLPPRAKVGTLLFTSANGVRAWVQAGGATDIESFYVGPASAAVGRRLGLPVTGIADGDVTALTTLVLERSPKGPLWHIRGRHAAGDLVGALEKKRGHRPCP